MENKKGEFATRFAEEYSKYGKFDRFNELVETGAIIFEHPDKLVKLVIEFGLFPKAINECHYGNSE